MNYWKCFFAQILNPFTPTANTHTHSVIVMIQWPTVISTSAPCSSDNTWIVIQCIVLTVFASLCRWEAKDLGVWSSSRSIRASCLYNLHDILSMVRILISVSSMYCDSISFSYHLCYHSHVQWCNEDIYKKVRCTYEQFFSCSCWSWIHHFIQSIE